MTSLDGAAVRNFVGGRLGAILIGLGLVVLFIFAVVKCSASPLDRVEDSVRERTGMNAFTFEDNPDAGEGMIKPRAGWVRKYIRTASVPILGTVTCNKEMLPALRAALSEVQFSGLAKKIKSDQYGGCYAPRYIDRRASAGLSMHAYGLAVDLNTATNQLGTDGDMDSRVVEIFEKWGFEWGGNWSRPDPMHFELVREPGPRA